MDARTLELEFSSGSRYQYFEVPEFTYRALMHAKSKGQFFQTSIDSKFRRNRHRVGATRTRLVPTRTDS